MGYRKGLWCLGLLWAKCVFVSDVSSESWKVSFFNGYMKGYSALGSRSHGDVAQVLQQSFSQAELVAPEKDRDLVDGVRSQVEYFASIESEEEKRRELAKCEEGMKQAQSSWARWAPDGVKAHFFVNKFAEESEKRQK